MLKRNELGDSYARIRGFLAKQSGLEVAEIEVDVRKLAQSNFELVDEINHLKRVINNIVEQIPLRILDRPLDVVPVKKKQQIGGRHGRKKPERDI